MLLTAYYSILFMIIIFQKMPKMALLIQIYARKQFIKIAYCYFFTPRWFSFWKSKVFTKIYLKSSDRLFK